MPYADPDKMRAKCREWHEAHRDEANAKRKAAYYASDSKKERAKRRSWYEANKEKALRIERERSYQKRYGISIQGYERMLGCQNGRCAICDSDKPIRTEDPSRTRYKRKHFSVDHDHETGKIRGLLCNRCNAALGWFEDYQTEALNYLMRNARSVA